MANHKPLSKLKDKNIPVEVREEAKSFENGLPKNDLYCIPGHFTKIQNNIYIELVNKLTPLSVLCDMDIYLLRQTALLLDHYTDLQIKINATGKTVFDHKRGCDVCNPLIKDSLAIEKQLNSNFSMLGLAPTSRSQLISQLAQANKIKKELESENAEKSKKQSVIEKALSLLED